MRQLPIRYILLACNVSAQFSELAGTDDGRLYFSTHLARGAHNIRSKIYRVTGEGIALIPAREGSGPTGPGAGLALTSGDGSITGYAVENYDE